MPNSMRSAILDGLPDRFLPISLTGVNCDIEILSLNIMKRFYVLLWRIPTFLARQVEADYTTLAKIDRQFRHIQRRIHVAHGANDQSRRYPKIPSAPFQALEHSRNHLLRS